MSRLRPAALLSLLAISGLLLPSQAVAAASPEGPVWAELAAPGAAVGSPAFLQSTRWDLRGGSVAALWRTVGDGRWEIDLAGSAAASWSVAAAPLALRTAARGEVAGYGWLETPAGPVRAVLLRDRVATPDDESVLYRWANPAGTLAWVLGPPGAGPFFERPARAGVIVDRLQGVTDLRIRYDQFPTLDPPVIEFGYHGEEVAVGDLLAGQTPANLGELVAQGDPGYWDFSDAETSLVPSLERTYVTIQVPPDGAETCYASRCGLASPDVQFYRRTDTLPPTYQQFVAVAPDGTDDYFVRALVDINAGEGSLGCFDQSPAFAFTHYAQTDGVDYWLEEADHWETGVFDCVPAGGIQCDCGGCNPDILLGSGSGRSGRAILDVLDAGTVRLPSGHYLDTLLVRIQNDFAGYPDFGIGCTGLLEQDARANWYYWLAPGLGPVVQLITGLGIENPDGESTVEAQVAAGLLPPLSIAAVDEPPSGVRVSWDPGELPAAATLDGFRVWWAQVGGPMDSNSGLLPPDTREHVVTGLLCDPAEYDFTVQIVLTYENPSTGAATTYETPFPSDSPFGWTDRWTDPGNWSDEHYPVMVRVRPSCGCPPPACPVANLRLSRGTFGLDLQWDFADDPCLESFSLLEAPDDATSLLGFSELLPLAPDARDALIPLDPPDPRRIFFYLVRPMGTGGAPACLEHYGEVSLCDPAGC